MISIVGLGPGSKESLTLGSLEVLKNSKRLYIRTYKHPTVEYIESLGINFTTYDKEYDKADSFDEVYKNIAKDLIEEYKKYGSIVYAVPGHPKVAEKSVDILVDLCEKEKIQYEVLPAVSFVDTMMERLKIDPINGIKIIDAFDIKNQVLDKRVGTIITQVYDRYIASEVKLALLEYYEDDTEVFFVRAAGVNGEESIRKIRIYEIDRQEDIDHLTSLYIEKNASKNYDFYDLLNIMDVLRGENGCPWDIEQTHESIKRYLIDESYEVIEAIDEKNDNKLIEELGDVLLQVIFHGQIGKEEGYFNINDIIQGICEKMINRHPHVFSTEEVSNTEEVLKKWDEIKKEEKGFKKISEELETISKSYPATLRAEKVQKIAKKVNFDFNNADEVFDKLKEELLEVKNVYKTKEQAKIVEEIGDLMFSTVNMARFLDIDPEIALNYTIDKFITRIKSMETLAEEQGIDFNLLDIGEKNIFWEKVKGTKS